MNNNNKKSTHSEAPILDSSLIVTTSIKPYNIKMIMCGDYCQLYFLKEKKIKRKKEDNFDLELKKININKMFDDYKQKQKSPPTLTNNIQLKNITRSKLECQRLAKANMKDWRTFITLTFADNIQDIKSANKRFRYFVDKVQRVKKDFKYLCITEFQKRGAVHYHLLCNADINDKELIYKQEDNPKFLHIKYWNDGFTSVEPMNSDSKKVVGYISKYMTKDIDNRLFNRHRYFYSRNLIKPIESYIDSNDSKDLNYYTKKIQGKELIYQSEYTNPYDNSKVTFLELLKK